MSLVKTEEVVCREVTEEDIDTALEWMQHHYGKAFPRDFLPKTGIIAVLNGIKVCVIPIYLESSSSVAVLGHCIINEKIPGRKVCMAIKECVKTCVSFARKKQRKFVISVFGRRSINKIVDQCGFLTADTIEEKFYYTGD